jgi:hypothetical protein
VEAADVLGICRATLRLKLRALGLCPVVEKPVGENAEQ